MRVARSRQAGFTLIELMVVIAIIAVLLAIIVPGLVRAKYQAHLAGCEHNQRALASALENYHTEFGTYPGSGTIGPTYPLQTGGYINSSSVACPSDLSRYTIEVSGDGHGFTINCNGIHDLVLSTVLDGFPQYTPNAGLVLGP